MPVLLTLFTLSRRHTLLVQARRGFLIREVISLRGTDTRKGLSFCQILTVNAPWAINKINGINVVRPHVSWNATSRPAFAKITPETPPIVNRKIKPITNNKGVWKFNQPPHKVANQEKTLIPVGTAITIVEDVKYARVSTSRPTV